jgi:hypothetical protein
VTVSLPETTHAEHRAHVLVLALPVVHRFEVQLTLRSSTAMEPIK